ncbi:MAG: tRNA glutamyl-Q(34) synthetase GluQRS [Rubrivivax sp.]
MPAVAPYRGRFAPSPSGPLHAGSLVAALASWLDARAHRGRWLVRIEDTDTPRCPPQMTEVVMAQLQALGLHADEAPLLQSTRGSAYQHALDQLQAAGWVYPCGCSRRGVDEALSAAGHTPSRHVLAVYPGTGRSGLHGKPARAWRMRVQHAGSEPCLTWHDRRVGTLTQDLAHEVGDFVLKRADGVWAYQLAVVVDDACQGITHVVRGADLVDNTPRQILLQRALGLPTPQYLHTPLLTGDDGHKLSKQNGAQAVDAGAPFPALREAATVLGLPPVDAEDVDRWLAAMVPMWAQRWLGTAAARRMA